MLDVSALHISHHEETLLVVAITVHKFRCILPFKLDSEAIPILSFLITMVQALLAACLSAWLSEQMRAHGASWPHDA